MTQLYCLRESIYVFIVLYIRTINSVVSIHYSWTGVMAMLDLLKNEEEILKHWKHNDTNGKVRKKNHGKKKFYFLDGPPYTSGNPHMGHVWVTSAKDALLRYRRYRGYDVHDRAGYDVHGLPIENKVEKELGISSKKDIESKVGVEIFMEKCKSYADMYKRKMDGVFTRFGSSLDYEGAYLPYRNAYIENSWGFIKKANEKGLVYTERKAVPYCVHCETAVSQGGSEVVYSDEEDPSIYVAFKITGRSKKADFGAETYLLIWTTTPWTLPANMAVAIDAKEIYVTVRMENKSLIMMKSRFESIFKSSEENAVIQAEFYGSELLGIHYINPLEEKVPAQRGFRKYHKVLAGEGIVSADEGTGIVHIAPGHGPEDYALGKKKRIPIFSPVDQHGNYTDEAGAYAGVNVFDANERILSDLREIGALILKSKITHSYQHCWRCNTKLIYLAMPQWFINIQKIKKALVRANKRTIWHPPEVLGWMEDVLGSAPDWVISRQRYWGTPLPIWKCSSCSNFTVIGSIRELESKAITPARVHELKDLHKPYIDLIEIKCDKCGSTMSRIPDVSDVWFDSGVAHTSSLTKEEFNRLFPADFIIEGRDQVRGWFSSLLKTGVIAYGKAPYKKGVLDGMMLGSDGRQMHKSWGNGIDPEDMIKTAGADAARLWILSHTQHLDIIYNSNEISEAGRDIHLLYNISQLLAEYSQAISYAPKKVMKPRSLESLPYEDRWIISRINSVMEHVTAAYENYDLHTATTDVRLFVVEDFSRFYLKIAKKRITDGNRKEARLKIDIINYVLYNAIVLFSPIIPFITERVYLDVYGKAEGDSIFLGAWPKHSESLIDLETERSFAIAKDSITAILSAREKSGAKLRWPIKSAMIELKEEAALPYLEKLSDLIGEYVNAAEVKVGVAGDSAERIAPNFSKLGPEFKSRAKFVAEKLKQADPKEVKAAISSNNAYVLSTEEGEFVIKPEHFSIEKASEADEAAFKYGRVSIDASIDKALRDGALAREFERRVQMYRKELNMKKKDRIELYYEAQGEIGAAVSLLLKEVMSHVGARKAHIGIPSDVEGRDFDIDGVKVRIGIKKEPNE